LSCGRDQPGCPKNPPKPGVICTNKGEKCGYEWRCCCGKCYYNKYIECFHSFYHGLVWGNPVIAEDECAVGMRCKAKKPPLITTQFLRNPDKLIRQWTSWSECTSSQGLKHRYKTEKQTTWGQCTPNCPKKSSQGGTLLQKLV